VSIDTGDSMQAIQMLTLRTINIHNFVTQFIEFAINPGVEECRAALPINQFWLSLPCFPILQVFHRNCIFWNAKPNLLTALHHQVLYHLANTKKR